MIEFIKANDSHREFLSQVCLDADIHYSQIMSGAFVRQSQRFLNNAFPSSYEIKLILNDKIPIGFIGGTALNADPYYLTALYLLNDYQRNGLGTKVHKRFVEELIRGRIATVYLFAHSKAYWAINFYTKVGYREIAETKEQVMDIDPDLLKFFLPNTILMMKILV